jgi:DNA gyrase subunit A
MLQRAAAEAARPEGLLPEHGWQPAEGGYRLSDAQAQAILELRLQRLTGLEQDKIFTEYKAVMALIVDLLDILANPPRVTRIIGEELVAIRDQFGDARRSEIVTQGADLSVEDLIAREDMVVTLSHGGYMKAQPVAAYRAQKRGGRGRVAAGTKEDDFIDHLFIANTHDHILCFSNHGRVYWLKVYHVPQGGHGARGKPVVNLVPLAGDEQITALLPVSEFTDTQYVFMATAMGTVKKTPLSEFSRPRTAGIIAVDLAAGDTLIGVALTDGSHDVMLFSSGGKAVRFDENDVRPMGRAAHGVRGMALEPTQTVISMLVAEDEAQSVLTATANGYGKRTPIVEHTRHARGTKGMIAIAQSERNGQVIAAALVRPEDEVMLISTGGVLIRMPVKSIREMGRATQGVTLISLGEGDTLAGLERVAETEVDEGLAGDAGPGADGGGPDAAAEAAPGGGEADAGDTGTAPDGGAASGDAPPADTP